MRLLFVSLISFSIFQFQHVYAQIPKNMQAKIDQSVNDIKQDISDLEKQISDAKKNKEDPETIKGLEDQLTMLKKQLSMVNHVTKTVSGLPKNKVQEAVATDNTDSKPVFPKKNPALLASLPKITSKAALTSYVNDLHNQFLKKVSPDLVASFKEIEQKLEHDGNKMAAEGISAWYNEAPSQSILLLTKAASQAQAPDLLISNLGAILNMGGLENKSLPILKYLVTIYPQNAMILNNLGQAFVGLGELDTAMVYFGRCVQHEPNHPQANNTAGEIELSKGNNTAAAQYFKNSLNGAFTEEAARHVKFVEPDMDINDYLKHNLHMPEYFNENKYKPPPQCQNVTEAEGLSAIYQGYHEMLNKIYQHYYDLELEFMDKSKKNLEQRALDAFAMKKLPTPPFYVKAGYAWDALMKKYRSDAEWLTVMDEDYEKRKKEIYEKYVAASTGSSDCAVQTGHVNNYLHDMADITTAWQLKHMAFNKKYINQLIYWSFLYSFSSDEFKMKFYGQVKNYLDEIGSIAKTELWGPPCEQIQQGNTPAADIIIEEPECPIDFELKLIVGKIALNCKKFSFSGGEVVKLKYEKNFSSKQSTMSVGIGVTLELGSKNFGGGFTGSASIDAGESVFITLDGNNSFSDLGLSVDAKASISIDKQSSLTVGEIVEEISRSKVIMGGEASAGYTVGVNSGLSFESGASFTPGPLKAILN